METYGRRKLADKGCLKRPYLGSGITKEICFCADTQDFEVASQKLLISCLAVLAFAIHKPNDVEPILFAVVAYAKLVPDLILPFRRLLISPYQPDH